MRKQLLHPQRQYLKFSGGLKTLTICDTVLAHQIMTLLYKQTLVLQVGESLMEHLYPENEVSGKFEVKSHQYFRT